jgi:CRP/FNR family transcriptional regulator, nitrogen oxide reductase regulator
VAIESALGACATFALAAGSSPAPGRLEGASLLLVEEGVVLVSASGAGTRRRMAVALAGESSLLLSPGPDERLEALTNSRLTLVTESAYQALLAVPAAAAAIGEGLALRLRDCHESLRSFSNPRHADRVREKLIQLARAHGKDGSEGIWLSLPLTHEVLAAMVGSTRETVTRAMSELTREGFVKHEGGAYRLVMPADQLRG